MAGIMHVLKWSLHNKLLAIGMDPTLVPDEVPEVLPALKMLPDTWTSQKDSKLEGSLQGAGPDLSLCWEK